MKVKQIVFTDINKAELLDAECAPIKENEVLVKTAYTAISNGTEKANITGDVNISVNSSDTAAHFPRYSGYSGSGIVVQIGDKVSKIKVGDRISGTWGFHKSYQVYGEDDVVKIDDGVSMQEAALSQIAAFPMAAVRKTRLEIGESAIVMGLGILGALGVVLLKAAGAVPIIAADPLKDRRDLALSLGADFALDPTQADFSEKVKEITCGGANTAIEVTGLGTGLNQVLDCMAKFGRVALLGCTRNSDFSVDYYKKVHGPGITLIGAHTIARPSFESSPGYWTHADDKKAFFKLIKYGRINLKNMIAEIHAPEEAPEVYSRLVNDKSFPPGVLFDWSKQEV